VTGTTLKCLIESLTVLEVFGETPDLYRVSCSFYTLRDFGPGLDAPQRNPFACGCYGTHNCAHHLVGDHVQGFTSIDNTAVFAIRKVEKLVKELSDPGLHLGILVFLLPKSSPLCGILRGDVKEDTDVRPRQTHLRLSSPGEGESGVVLGYRVDNAREVVTINDDYVSIRNICSDFGRSLPPVGRKK